ALPVRGDRCVVSDGDGERALLRSAGIDDRTAQRGHDWGSIRVVELDSLVLLEEAAHRRAVAVCLIDIRIVRERDRTAQPCGERRTGWSSVARRGTETGERIDGRAKTARSPTELLSPDQHRVRGRKCRRVEGLHLPTRVGVTKTLVAAQRGDVPPPA